MAAESLLGLIGVVVGVVLGGFFEHFRAKASFQREKSWLVYQDRRRRLEQLYESVVELGEVYMDIYGKTRLALQTGDLPPKPGAKVPWARLRMLVDLYMPEARNSFQELRSRGTEFGQVLGEIIVSSPTKGSRLIELGQSLDLEHQKLAEAQQAFLQKLVRLSESWTEQVQERLRDASRSRPQ